MQQQKIGVDEACLEVFQLWLQSLGAQVPQAASLLALALHLHLQRCMLSLTGHSLPADRLRFEMSRQAAVAAFVGGPGLLQAASQAAVPANTGIPSLHGSAD